MAIPVPKVIPVSLKTLAPDEGGITREKNTELPAVGLDAVLWNATFLAAALEL